MKIFLKLPGGIEFWFEREPRQPMSDVHFGALCGLAAAAMFFGFLVLSVALR